jgi:hypothetical protein
MRQAKSVNQAATRVEQVEQLLEALEDTFADIVEEPLPKDMLDLLRALDAEPAVPSRIPWLRGRGR